MSSRANARTWPYPRHRDFEDRLRKTAEGWFAGRHLPVNDRYPYILADRDKWEQNIILPQVAAYIQEEWQGRQDRDKGFPLHKYLHHGLSSQAMLFNLVGPLILAEDLSPLRQVCEERGVVLPPGALHATLEWEDRTVFNEDIGQPTSLDLVLADAQGSPRVFIEAKLVEREFGRCSVFVSGDCDGRNPAGDFSLCYLHHLGRKYWTLLEQHGFLTASIKSGATCVLSDYYQFFREALCALEKGGTFVLLYDARNPTFYCNAPQGPRGLMPFLLSLVPERERPRVATITIQQVVAAIKASGEYRWIAEFEVKYGLT